MENSIFWRIAMIIIHKEHCNEHEADVIVSDGEFEILCYCLYEPEIGSHIKEITTFFAEDIMRVQCKECVILKSNKSYYSYHLQGEVIDTDVPAVRIGGFKVNLDVSLPKDIIKGEYVEFDVCRLDCWGL